MSDRPLDSAAERRQRWLWVHVLVIAVLMISRRPDAMLHPQFWAEDGQVFYHDAYMSGPASLWEPLNGYLQTLPRLVALGAVAFPLAWAPAIYVAFAFAVQLLPVILMLSRRMETALPSWPARLTMAYFYAAVPNASELNLHLTDAQWHLSAAAFLTLAASPAGLVLKTFDAGLLFLSGLSGPFCIFLTPVAWFEHWRKRAAGSLLNAVITTATGVLQAGLIFRLAGSTRARMPLNPSFVGFLKILVNNLILGGPLGHRLMTAVLGFATFNTPYMMVLLTIMATLMMLYAASIGPMLYKEAIFFAAGVLATALVSPVVAQDAPLWQVLAPPGHGMRYFFIPMLAWFGAMIILVSCSWRFARACAAVFLSACLLGVLFTWFDPPYLQTGFTNAAQAFADAATSTTMRFPENPAGWQMVLTKR